MLLDEAKDLAGVEAVGPLADWQVQGIVRLSIVECIAGRGAMWWDRHSTSGV